MRHDLRRCPSFARAIGIALCSLAFSLALPAPASAQAPPAPALIGPNGFSPVANPAFSWFAVSPATTYNLYVYNSVPQLIFSASYTASAICASGPAPGGGTANICTATPTLNLAVGAYSWKVRPYNGGTSGSISGTMYFNAAPPNWNSSTRCPASSVFATGDFDGDGYTDRLCNTSNVVNISRSTSTGVLPSVSWMYGSLPSTLRVADFDGDGKADLSKFNGGVFNISKSTGTQFGAFTAWGTPTGTWQGQTYSCQFSTSLLGVGDFNGDGRPDVYCKDTNNKIFIGLSSGSAFTFSIFASHSCSNQAERVGGADFDGDGKDDWFCASMHPGGLFVLPSTGTSFDTTVGAFTGQPASFCAWDNLVLGDFNADGKTDATCPANGKLSLSTGVGLLDQSASGAFCVGSNKVIPLDVDGDATTELVCDNNGGGPTDIQVRKWNGQAWDAPMNWITSFCGNSLSAGDFNGDGRPDIICNRGDIAVVGTDNVLPTLMTVAENGLGGTTTVSYAPSSGYPNVNNPPTKDVVASVTLSDGNGGTFATTFSYAGGKMDRLEKQFLGFQTVRANKPCLAGEVAPCPYTETTLSQELPSLGSPVVIAQKDGAGHTLSAVASTYTITPSGTLPRKSLLTQLDQFTYDLLGAFKKTTSTNQYDAYGNLTQTIFSGDTSVSGDELQTDSTYVPNASAYVVNRLAKVERRPPGGTLLAAQEYWYDGASAYTQPPVAGAVTKARSWINPGNRWVAKTIGYDAWGNPTSVVDETGKSTTTAYHATNHIFPISSTNGAAETTSTVWDVLCGAPTQTTDPNSQVTSFQYDALCRPTRTDLPLAGYSINSYLDFGNPTLQRARVEATPPTGSSGGNVWSEDRFDGLGKVYRTEARGPSTGQNILVERTFNARGGVATSTAPRYQGETAEVTNYIYDALDRVTSIEHPDGAEVSRSYGIWTQTATDENGKPVTTRYDAYGRVKEVEATLSGQPAATQSGYDPLGRLTSMTDAVGNTWGWTFNSVGQNLTRSDPDAGSWSYAYDDAGRITSQTDAKSQTTTFTYDAAGRLQTKTSPVGTVTLTRSEARAGYFNVGRVTTVTSPGTAVKTDHDALGHEVKITRTLDAVDYVVQRRYDASGSLTGITYPDNDTVGTTANPLLYDDAGRLRAAPGFISQVTYDGAGRPLVRTNGNGTQTTYSYDAQRGFLEGILTGGTGSIQNLSYGYDPAGLVTQVTSPNTNEAWSYAYDDLYRITQATNLNTPAETQSFQYDEIGRITYNSKVGTYTYPGAGSARPHAPATVNGGSYNYDPNGNLTSGGGRAPTWDAENRISSIGSTTFTYDAFGERLKKTAGGITSRYPVGDDYEITNGTITKYVSIGGLGVVAKRVGSTTYWLHTDRQGSIQAITDSASVLVQRRTYRPYGAKIADTTGHVESRGWIDQRQDETGLTYLHARYFDPQLGTFVSPDPLHPAEPGVGTNRYSYAFGDPANGTDRSGLDCYVTYGGWSRGPLGNVTASAPSTVSVSGNCTTSASGMMGLVSRIGDAGDSAYERQQVRAAAIRQQAGERNKTAAIAVNPTLPAGDTTGDANPIASAIEVLTNLLEFVSGSGDESNYGDGSQQANDMIDSPGVNAARSYFADGSCQTVVDYAASFGVTGGATPGMSIPGPGGSYLTGHDGQFLGSNLALYPTRQLMGSYTVGITGNRNGTATFLLQNTMSLTSLGLHLLPERSRGMFANKNINISWTEASPCVR